MAEKEHINDKDENYNENWAAMSLEEAILDSMKPEESISSKFKGTVKLTLIGFGIEELLQIHERHPDLISRPSKRAMMTRIRRAIKNTQQIQKTGHKRSTMYFNNPHKYVEETHLKVATNKALTCLMEISSPISIRELETMMENKGWEGNIKLAQITSNLQAKGIIEMDAQNLLFRCTEAAWTYDPLVKQNSTYTLTSRTEMTISKLMESMNEEQVKIPGFGILSPATVTRSGVIDIAIAFLSRSQQVRK